MDKLLLLENIINQDIMEVVWSFLDWKPKYNDVIKELKTLCIKNYNITDLNYITEKNGMNIDSLKIIIKILESENKETTNEIRNIWKTGEIGQQLISYIILNTFLIPEKGYIFGKIKQRIKSYCINICPEYNLNELKIFIAKNSSFQLIETQLKLMNIIVK